jgi:beta-alanine--pyruvate transaminase
MGVHVRFTGDIIAISPPLTIEKNEIDRIFSSLADAIKSITAAGEAGLNFNNYLKNEQQWASQD